MHGSFSHFGRPRPSHDVLTEDAMFYAQMELYAGQAVICGGKPTFVQYVRAGLVWLVGFTSPVPVRSVEAVA
jgi:hypothetical protein